MQGQKSAQLVHTVPGRIRVRLDRASRSPDSMQSLSRKLSELEGVREVRVNPRTGSMLLTYDPDLLGMEQLYLAARSAGIQVSLPGEPPNQPNPNGTSPVASWINSLFGRADTAVSDLSGGKIDARTVVPMTLGAWAVRRIAQSRGQLGAVPWYVLLWYAFELFTKYNRRRRAG